MKIRILNGGHQVLANVAELLSIETITDAVVDPDIQAYFRKVQTQEILPYVAAVPGITPPDYLTLIERRFSNPSIRDTTRRVAFDGSSRHVGFILPVVRDALEKGGSITGLALVEALWAHMCAGVRVDGSTIEPNDPHWDSLSEAARRSMTDPSAWLAQTQIYGTLSASAEFSAQFAFWHANISENGVRLTLRQYCNLSS
jgi:mannitol 2-dehydrogenase